MRGHLGNDMASIENKTLYCSAAVNFEEEVGHFVGIGDDTAIGGLRVKECDVRIG